MVKSLNLASGLASRFDFSSATVRALDIKDARLTEGKISSVRTESTSIAAADVRCVEFSNCELGHLRWAGGRISQTRFNGCKLLGAKFENVFMEHVVFTDCKIDYAALNQMRTSGPVMFIRCSLREAEFTGCDMTRSLMDECDLALVNFESGKYSSAAGSLCLIAAQVWPGLDRRWAKTSRNMTIATTTENR